MKVKDFYLIESIDISILEESQKKLLNKQLTLFHEKSSIIEKTTVIDKIIDNSQLKGVHYLYNEWLYNFVTKQLEIAVTEEETQHLQKILGNCYYTIGGMQLSKSNYDQALKSSLEAAKIYKKQGDKEALFKTYINIGKVFFRKGEITSAIEFSEKAALLIPFVKKEKPLGDYYLSFGALFGQQGNYLKALDYFYKCLEIFEAYNMRKGAAIAYTNIGYIMFDQGDFEGALNHYLKALELNQKDEFNVARTYTDIGDVYKKRKENDIALEYYNKAIQIQSRLEFKGELAYSYKCLGTVYENKNNNSLALKFYEKSLKLSKENDNKETLLKVLSKIGALEIKEGKTAKATAHIQLAFTIAKEFNSPYLIIEATKAKLALAVTNKDYKLAYEMECLKNEMKEKIQNEHIQKKLIEQKYEYESKQALGKKDEEIELEKENARIIEEQSDLLELKNDELASKNKIINKQVLELEDLIKKLQESNESLNQFAAVAAHDLKAPLRNIQGFSQLLHKKYATQFPKGDLDLFMYIIKGCTSLKELIDGLLNYSSISSVNLELECVDLAEIVSDVKNNLTNVIEEANVNLHISEKLPKVFGQPSLLFQVFLNFINNAIKFRRIEKDLLPTIWVEAEQYSDDQIKISIKDNGIGIEQKHQKQIFGIFKKLHSSTEYEGSGIGLSVCKKIIERSGGKVWLESEKNVGTTFFFTIKQYQLTVS